MADLKKILGFIIIRLLSTAIASVVLLGLLFKRWRKGKDFFTVKPRPTPPSIISDPKWGTHSYVNLKSQGIRLHYVEKGDRNKPLLLCLHGYPECWFSWRHQLEHLSDKYWVVAVDMRGYADSDKPSAKSAYDIAHLSEDIRQLVPTLGKDKCILMAHDWGAIIAWQVIINHPELFDHHISCNGPHPKVFMRVMNSSWKQRLMSWYVIFFQTPWIPELSFQVNDMEFFNKAFRGEKNNVKAFPDEVLEVFKYYFSQKGAITPPINYYRCINFGDLGQHLSKVKVPTLIIWGEEDKYLSKEMAVLGGKECESAVVKYIEGATHWVQQDEPELVNRIIREYLHSSSS